MLDPPRQNWTAYRERAEAIDRAWVRALSPAERFDLYADLFAIIYESTDGSKDQARLDQWSWEQKLAVRCRQVTAYMALDQLRRERAAAKDSC